MGDSLLWLWYFRHSDCKNSLRFGITPNSFSVLRKVEGVSIKTSFPALFFGKAINRGSNRHLKKRHSRSNPNAIPPCGGAPIQKLPSKSQMFFCFLLRKSKMVEHHLLCRPVVDTIDPPPTSVPVRPYHKHWLLLTGIGIQQFDVLRFRRSERVSAWHDTFSFLHSIPTAGNQHPQSRKFVFIPESQPIAH